MAANKTKAAARKRTAFGARDQQLVGYQELAKAAQHQRDEALAGMASAVEARNQAQARVGELRADIEALKGELAGAYASIERQAGYLDRVHETDLLEDRPQYELPKVQRRPGPRVPPTSVIVRAPDRGGYSVSVETPGRDAFRAATSRKPFWNY